MIHMEYKQRKTYQNKEEKSDFKELGGCGKRVETLDYNMTKV